jgi:hypothetical protein
MMLNDGYWRELRLSVSFPVLMMLAVLSCDSGLGQKECEELYNASPVKQCMYYERYFQFYACTDDELTDPACFRDCISPLKDDSELCYHADRCLSNCSSDDATGCENAYGGTDVGCIDYKEFFVRFCDPRLARTKLECFTQCNDAQSECTDLRSCLDKC